MRRNSRHGLSLIVAILLCVSLIATACSSGGSGGSTPSGETSTPSSSNTGNSSSQSTGQTADTPKPKPDYTVTAARYTIPGVNFLEGDDWDNNEWYRAYKENFGFTIVHKLLTPYNDYETNVNLLIASGDLPDIFIAFQEQVKQMVEAGMLEDLTDVYEEYATDFTKENLAPYEVLMDSVRFDGRMMAFPHANTTIDNAAVLWVRTDWLKKLNLPEPKTMQDVLNIAEAFATQDPDGDGQNNTYGLALTKDLWGAYGSLESFFNGYHAYPNIWIKKGDRLEYGMIQPEMKPALAELQRMYAAGLIDPEFAVKEFQQFGEDIAANKLGLAYARQSTMITPGQAAKDLNPEMDWQAYPVLSIDDRPALVQYPFGGSIYWVVRKGFEHPEALIQMANFILEKGWGPDTEFEEYQKYLAPADGRANFLVSFIYTYPAHKNQRAAIHIEEALKNNDTSKLNHEEKNTYNRVKSYLDGDTAQWGTYKTFGPGGAQTVLNHYTEQNLVYNDQFFGTPTDAMGKYKASLDTLAETELTKIIMGESPVDAFDKFVSDWKNLGGDQMTKEVNDWYASR